MIWGVYALVGLTSQKIYYIGCSRHLKGRRATHRKLHTDFHFAMKIIRYSHSRDEALKWELFYIEHLSPLLNSKGTLGIFRREERWTWDKFCKHRWKCWY